MCPLCIVPGYRVDTSEPPVFGPVGGAMRYAEESKADAFEQITERGR